LKCRRCGKHALVDLKSHNTAFCRDCFLLYVERQVERAVREHRMFNGKDRLLVCVSGGKDSIVLWDLLLRMGYNADGLHIDLGIEGYSEHSRLKTEAFAEQHQARLITIALAEHGMAVPDVARRKRRAECSVCGTIKRHFFNRTAVEQGYDVVATGHNLDDEAGRLLGNLLHWQWNYLAKQSPVLPAVGDSLVKKVAPLCRLSERETAACALLAGIDYVLEECPLSRGATSLHYKQVMNLLEDWMPGTKSSFYRGFLKESNRFREPEAARAEHAERCSYCGSPSFIDPCNFCRLTRNG
jgi:uncharacterized protein (TIGR00269 family)